MVAVLEQEKREDAEAVYAFWRQPNLRRKSFPTASGTTAYPLDVDVIGDVRGGYWEKNGWLQPIKSPVQFLLVSIFDGILYSVKVERHGPRRPGAVKSVRGPVCRKDFYGNEFFS